MRHLFVTQDFGPDLGGMARRHVEIARRLGPDTVVSTVAAPRAMEFDERERYTIRRQSFPFSRANRFLNQMHWAWDLVRLSRSADVVHCGNIRPNGYAMYWAHRRAHVPYLLYVNGGDLLRERRKASNFFKRKSGAAIFGHAAGVVATSEWVGDLTRDIMRELGVASPPPVRSIALGTDPRTFTPAADKRQLRRRWSIGDAPILLTVARLVEHKGQDTVIRALPAIVREHPDVRYVLVGEGEERLHLRSLAEELDVSRNVVFAGALYDQELPETYATSTIYVGMSRITDAINVEGFGISFLEASASGIPVVAGDSGGVRSAVQDGVTGFVLPPTDVETLASTINRLLGDARLRDTLGANGRRAVEDYFNWDRAASDTIEFVREVVGR